MAKIVYGRRKNWFGPQNLVLDTDIFFDHGSDKMWAKEQVWKVPKFLQKLTFHHTSLEGCVNTMHIF